MILLDPTTCISLDVAVSLSVCICQLQAEVFFCSVLWRIETALGNIKESLVVDLHILVIFFCAE